MTIKDKKKYEEVDARLEQLLEKGTELGGMDLLSEEEQEEMKVLSEAAYNWECEEDPHPWRVKPSLIAAIKVALERKDINRRRLPLPLVRPQQRSATFCMGAEA